VSNIGSGLICCCFCCCCCGWSSLGNLLMAEIILPLPMILLDEMGAKAGFWCCLGAGGCC